MEKCIYDDCNKDKITEWDFEKNIDTDIFEEEISSSKQVSWICSNCGFKYDAEINNHNQYKCPKCGDSKLMENLVGYSHKARKKL